MAKRDSELVEDLRIEYREVSYFVRLMATFRIGILPFSAGFISWVVSAVLRGYEQEDPVLRIATLFSGLLGIFLLLALDERLVRIYDSVVGRGASIETLLDIKDGLHERITLLIARPRLRNITSMALTLMAVVLLCAVIVEIFILTN